MKPSTLLRALALSLCLAVSGAGLTAHAAPDSNDDLTLAQNIATPSAPSNASNALIRHAQGLGNYFIRKGYKVRYPRKGEVAEIIIPSDLLFLPNTAELRPDASKTLGLFKSLVERPQLYKLLVVETGAPVAASNPSIAGRRANRRVEICITPTRQTIDMARNGKL